MMEAIIGKTVAYSTSFPCHRNCLNSKALLLEN
jgi:hypothetical protein